jgi:dolichol-phosphate mannosyltransferase
MSPSGETVRSGPGTRLALAMTGLRLGVVSPMANEASTAVAFVEAVLDECAAYPFASVTFFAIVDRVSRDGTREILDAHGRSEPRLAVVWAPETTGVADAYLRGYREALAAGCDWILELDAGFSHDPTAVPAFLEAMAAGSDCVFGTRFGPGGSNLGKLSRRAISRSGTALTNLLLGTRLSDMTSGFELFTRVSLEAALARGVRSRGPFFQTELKAHCRGLRTTEIPIRYAGGEHAVGVHAVVEALANLGRLFARRVTGAFR